MSLFRVHLKQGGEPFNLDLSAAELGMIEELMHAGSCETVFTDSQRVSVSVGEIAALVPIEWVPEGRK